MFGQKHVINWHFMERHDVISRRLMSKNTFHTIYQFRVATFRGPDVKIWLRSCCGE